MNGPIVMQLLLTLVALLGTYKVVARVRARAIGTGLAGIWVLGTIVFLFFVWRPDIATRFSQLLGVGRGVDAAIYLAVAFLFYIILRVFIRLEGQEHLITKLVSEIALLRDEHKKK